MSTAADPWAPPAEAPTFGPSPLAFLSDPRHTLNRINPTTARMRDAWCVNNPTHLELFLKENAPG